MLLFDLIIQWVESSNFGPKSDELGHRIPKTDFIPSEFAKSDGIRLILMQLDLQSVEKVPFSTFA